MSQPSPGFDSQPDAPRSTRARSAWELIVVAFLLPTVPAFYLEMLDPARSTWAMVLYGAAALVLMAETLLRRDPAQGAFATLRARPWQWLTIIALAGAAVLPASASSTLALGWRGMAATLTLLRFALALQPALTRGGLPWLLALALAVLGLCGVGFWWLEPQALSFGDGLWLAFTTAATVGYGDIVPTTPASKVFAAFVVLLGFAVLSTVTAAIAARWIETEERRIEREILHDMHRQLRAVREEVSALRRELERNRHAP